MGFGLAVLVVVAVGVVTIYWADIRALFSAASRDVENPSAMMHELRGDRHDDAGEKVQDQLSKANPNNERDRWRDR